MTSVLGGTAGIPAAVVGGSVGALAGSIASQAFAVTAGLQDRFSWKQAALSAVSGGLAGVVPLDLASSLGPIGNAVARGAVSSALTQGVSVAVGLQTHFSWSSVAASAAGAGVGAAVGPAMDAAFGKNSFGASLATSLTAGTATALARGGRVSAQQVATDAFGNALSSSASAASSTLRTYQEFVLGNAVGQAVADAGRPSDALGEFISDKLSEQERRDRYGFGNAADGLGLKLTTTDWDNALARRPQGGANFTAEDWKQQRVAELQRMGRYSEAEDLRAAEIRLTDSDGLHDANRTPLGAIEGRGLAEGRVENWLKPEALNRPPMSAPPEPIVGPGVLRFLGRAAFGLLYTPEQRGFTTNWEAAGATFAYNPSDFTLRIKDGDTGTRLAVPGIHNPSQYTDAQYLAYVTYKANGGQLNINDYVSIGAPDGVGLSVSSKGRGFDVTDAVTISGRRAIDLGHSYEIGVRDLYGNVPFKQREYQAFVNGEWVDGVADNVTRINGKNTAVEAKFVDDWNASLRNPNGRSGQYPWSIREQQKMVDQATKYSAGFEGGVLYHTNSTELATHYSNLFSKLGIQNFKFVITPAIRK